MDVTLFGPSFTSQVVLWVEEAETLGFPRKARVRAVLSAEVKLADVVGYQGQLEWRDDQTTRRFMGLFTEVNLLATASVEERVLPSYEFTLVATIGALAGAVDCRIFQLKTTQDIVSELLTEFGLAQDQQD